MQNDRRLEGSFQLLASGNPDDGALTIHADARVLGATLGAGNSLSYEPDPTRHLYLVPSARVRINGQEANAREIDKLRWQIDYHKWMVAGSR